MKRKFILCKNCGNLMEIIKDAGVTPICCGKDMQVLIANESEGALEKHIPVIIKNDNTVTVTVGEILHPMEENHYISWIYLETTSGIKRVNLKPGDQPSVTFALLDQEEVIGAYAYCNLHGLWLKTLK